MDRDVMKYGSLFSGVGGFDRGFDLAGFDCAWQCENEPSCISVLERHYPSVKRYADIREIKNAEWVDVICGGWPCQDLSVAGKRAGLSGERSGLFFEFIRVINETRPSYVVWENVPGLLSSNNGRDFATCLSELERVGYCGAWTNLDARFFGLAQRRRRIFGVFALTGIGAARCAEILSLSARSQWNPEKSREARTRTTACLDGSPYADREAEHSRLVAATLKQRGRGATDEVMDNLQIANAVTTGTLPADYGKQAGNAMGEMENGIIPILEAGARTNGDGYRDGDGIGKPGVNRPGRRREDDENLIVNCFNGYTGGPDDNDAQANHLVASPITAAYAKSASDENDGLNGHLVTHALSSEGADASEDGTGRGTPLVTVFESRVARNGRGAPSKIVPPLKAESGQTGKGDSAPLAAGAFGVRRLTPKECERLQGFPNDFTRYDADGKEISDSARYRMLGNAVAVPVSKWIAKRILAVAKNGSC